MRRSGRPRVEMDLGLICPSCGTLSTPDPETLKQAVRDVRLWARCLAGSKAIVMALLSRLADNRRPMQSLPSHD